MLACGRARAAEPEARVHLSLPSCELPKLASDELRAAAALELNTSGLSLLSEGDPRSPGDIEASIDATCAEDGVLELHALWGPNEGSRALKLKELPVTSRPRAVALALAELLAAVRPEEQPAAIEVELAEDPVPAKEVAPVRESRPAPTARPENTTTKSRAELAPGSNDGGREGPSAGNSGRTRHALTLQGEIRSFALEPIVPGIRAGYEFNRFVLGLGVLRGRAAGYDGSVTAAITYGYWEWRIQELGRPDRPWFTFGPRLGLGLVSLMPIPTPTSTGASTTDIYAEVAQFCELWATLPPFRFGAQFELGYAMGALAYETSHLLASYGGPFGSLMLEATLLL